MPRDTVSAATDGILLAVRRADLDARIAEDPGFAGRMRGALTEFAANRGWEQENAPRPTQVAGGAPDDLHVHELIEKLLRGDLF